MRTLLRPAAERGHANHGWLDARHSFSFASYHDPRHMGWGPLRVLNEDRVAGGGGFPPHGHADMEIITVILEGALQHRDSMGNGAVIRPGEVQHMRAGTGVTHSEFNASRTDPVHLLQIWLLPNRRGLQPAYGQVTLPEPAPGESRLDTAAAPGGGPTAVDIAADAALHRAILAPGGALQASVTRGRAWVQAARGQAVVAGQPMRAGDGLAVEGAGTIAITSANGAELLVFDLGN